jgi:hypothetical protein
MCVDCVLASPRIAQVDPRDEPLPEVVLSQRLVLFRLVDPSLQPVELGLFPGRGVWFPSHLPLEGTDCIQKFLAVTGGPWYPG